MLTQFLTTPMTTAEAHSFWVHCFLRFKSMAIFPAILILPWGHPGCLVLI